MPIRKVSLISLMDYEYLADLIELKSNMHHTTAHISFRRKLEGPV